MDNFNEYNEILKKKLKPQFLDLHVMHDVEY